MIIIVENTGNNHKHLSSTRWALCNARQGGTVCNVVKTHPVLAQASLVLNDTGLSLILNNLNETLVPNNVFAVLQKIFK